MLALEFWLSLSGEFWLGLGLGSIIGVGGNLIANCLQYGLDGRKQRRRLRREREISVQISAWASMDCWGVGGLSTRIRVIEAVRAGYDPAKFMLTLDNAVPHRSEDEVRDLINASYLFGEQKQKALQMCDERIAYWASCVQAVKPGASPVYDNNDLVCILDWKSRRPVSGTNRDEVPHLSCVAATASYIAHRASVDVFRSLSSDLRFRLAAASRGATPFLGLNAAVSIAVISSDHRLVFGRRRNLAVDSEKIICGVGEGIRSDDLRGPTLGLPAPWQAAIRGLQEEFGLTLPDDKPRLRITAFCRSEQYLEYYFLGCVDLREAGPSYSIGAIRAAHTRAEAQDKYETMEILDCDLTTNNVANFLWENRNQMTEYGKIVACMALLTTEPLPLFGLTSAVVRRFGT